MNSVPWFSIIFTARQSFSPVARVKKMNDCLQYECEKYMIFFFKFLTIIWIVMRLPEEPPKLWLRSYNSPWRDNAAKVTKLEMVNTVNVRKKKVTQWLVCFQIFRFGFYLGKYSIYALFCLLKEILNLQVIESALSGCMWEST